MKKLLLSVLMVFMALPALAVEVPMPEGMKLNIYGSLRAIMYYSGYNNAAKVASDDFNYAMQGNSRLGLRFSVGGFFSNAELDFQADQKATIGASNFGFRQLYAGYKFDNGFTLTGGQKTTLAGYQGEFADMFWNDNGLNGFGVAGDVRRPLVIFGYAGFELALVQNSADADNVPVGLKKSKVYLPRFEVAYNMNYDSVKGKIFASYALFSDNVTGGSSVYDIHAYNVGVFLKSAFKSPFSILGGAFFSTNSGLYNGAMTLKTDGTGTTAIMPEFDATKKEIVDTMSFGAAVQGGYTFNEMCALYLGVGYQWNNNDNWDKSLSTVALYLQAPIKFNKYVTLKPQVGYYAAMGKYESSALLAGAQLRFDF